MPAAGHEVPQHQSDLSRELLESSHPAQTQRELTPHTLLAMSDADLEEVRGLRLTPDSVLKNYR